MRLRSLLFVPGDRPARFDKAARCGADAIILDLEDSVTAEHKTLARASVRDALAARIGGPALFVRINPIGGDHVDADLDALTGVRPDALVLPKASGAASIAALDSKLAPRGLDGVPILPIATETPQAIFRLGTYQRVSSRLIGLTWGVEDLLAAIGAATSREVDGRYTPPYQMVRALALFAAGAADVAAIETVFPDFRDLRGLAGYAAGAARDGFKGMMAIHPDQVGIINEAFAPSSEAVAHARAVVAAFEAQPGAGVVQLDGSMIDAPHLKQAKAVLDRI